MGVINFHLRHLHCNKKISTREEEFVSFEPEECEAQWKVIEWGRGRVSCLVMNI